ncbi:MAG: tRNA guanosine(34) transglycosylase Tgt [Planctomycetota bacterium]
MAEHEPLLPASITTKHGDVRLPVFLPDATRAVVRGLGADDLERCGIGALVANAYHLGRSPGLGVVRRQGGLHRFLAWPHPIFTDSGGFQIYSLLTTEPRRGTVTRQGFLIRSSGSHHRLTPAKAVLAQHALAADVAVCLDHCTHPSAAASEQRRSVEHTVAWAQVCKNELERLKEQTGQGPLLFAVVQGGADAALRRECASRILEIGFDGYAFGGWPFHDDGRLREEVALVASLVPRELPLWGLGIGNPDAIEEAFALGYRVFDCVLPTRDARQGRLLVPGEDELGARRGEPLRERRTYHYLYIQDEAHTRSDRPLSSSCDCLTCTRYTRGYLHHLFGLRDPLAVRLATHHNLRFYVRLMERLHTQVPAGEKHGC